MTSRRTTLIESLVKRAKIGTPRYGYVSDDFVRNVVSVRVEAIVGGIKKFAVILKARDCSEGKDVAASVAVAMLPGKLTDTLKNNPNTIGSKGELPR